MQEIIKKLACRIGEGFQSSTVIDTERKLNAFHRTISFRESSDLSFVIGLTSSGIRCSACIKGEELIGNYNQMLEASRRHLPLVINTSARLVSESKYASINNYNNINAIQQTGCFQLIATSPQEEIYITLVARRIAELALIPGMVIADYNAFDEDLEFPSDDKIIEYLGDPDDQIDSPTPAQEMIFGRTRKRVPNLFSFDTPVMLGAKKDAKDIAYEEAANRKYFYDHLETLIEKALTEFKEVFKTDFNTIISKGKPSNFALVTSGGQLSDLYDKLYNSKRKIQLVQINQLNPFPYQAVTDLLSRKKAIMILENTSVGADYSPFYNHILHSIHGWDTKVYSAKYSTEVDMASLELAVEHMESNNEKRYIYVGIPFTKKSSAYPKHKILLQEIERQYPNIAQASIQSNIKPKSTSAIIEDEIPKAIIMHRDHGPHYSRLARFHDDTAFFYQHDEQQEVVADPFAAFPVIPGSSASFFNQSTKREMIPVFDASSCTGCGDCFVLCPHSALPPIAIGIEELMKSGATIASQKGEPIIKLTPLFKHLAKFTEKIINENGNTTLKDMLPEAFSRLVKQLKLEDEKLVVIQKEFDRVLSELLVFRPAITEHFYTGPSLIEPGSGELFSLVVDPMSCTGCSLCAEVCEEDALTMEAVTPQHQSGIVSQFKLWEQLPDTSGNTIIRLHNDQDYSSLAAIQLSRNYYMSMTGAGHSETKGSNKTMLRIISTACEAVMQPKILLQLKRIEELINVLTDNIYKQLRGALPDRDLDSLSKLLKHAESKKMHIQDVVSKMADEEQGKFVDSEDLVRKISLVENLKDLKWLLTEGPNGVGRSRYGLLLSGSDMLAWAQEFPVNNFTSPCIIHANGSVPDQLAGMFHGQLRYVLDHIKLMRRAELESKNKYDPTVHDDEIAELGWEDLTDHEMHLVPPVCLVAEREEMDDSNWNGLSKLLAEEYPYKVILLDHNTFPARASIAAYAQIYSKLISAITLKNAFVFQGGLGNQEHLFAGLMDGIDRSCPAIFNLHAAHSEIHDQGNVDFTPHAALALNSRSFPAFRYDPTEKNDFLLGVINLDGNKEIHENWVEEEISIPEQKSISYKISWADWAFTQNDLKKHFTAIESADVNMPVSEYLEMGLKEREKHEPVIIRIDQHGIKYYGVSEEIIQMCDAVLTNWNTLRELAGLRTEFPTKLRSKIEAELTKKYQTEAAELKNNYEQQFKTQQAAQTEIVRQRLKEKLLALSKMARKKAPHVDESQISK